MLPAPITSLVFGFFFSSRRRHTRFSRDWSSDVCSSDLPGQVDFLKIDVEGAERAVLEGADWTRHRPRVLVVEATAPGSPKQVHEEWEPLLLAAGYRFGLFDGLNRFYAQADDEEALSRLAAPASVFDSYERHEHVRLREDFEAAQAKRPAEVG